MTVRRRDGALLRQFRTLYNIGAIGDLTDGQLLERFATDADEAAELAFSALVERHEALVWRVCLAITCDEHAAEDAFQATLLVLVRKARSLWVRDSLGPWLHQVACRTASCLRRAAIRRRLHERRRAELDAGRCVEIGPPHDADRDAAVHEEVNRLPEKYRAPVVLCDLEGRTHREAARCLGWPIGTVKSRQLQGRRRIRERLVRRGFGPVCSADVVDSSRRTPAAAMPKEVSRATVLAVIRQSARLSAGVGVSSHIVALTQEVLRAMLWIRIRYFAVAALAVGIASGGASVYVIGSQELAGKTAQTPPPEDAKDSLGRRTPAERQAMLRAQQLATRRAKAWYEIARLNRELAELAVEEYEVVGYPRDLTAAFAEIKFAKSDLTRSLDRLEWARRMFDKGYVSQATKAAEELSLQKAQFALDQAGDRQRALMEYTKSRKIKELRSEVEKARVVELEKQAGWESESAKEVELERRFRSSTH